MTFRSRDSNNREQRDTTAPAGDNVGVGVAHALGSHTDTVLGTPGAPQDGWAVVWDQTTGKYILEQISGLLSFYAAQGQNGTPAGDITLTAAASDTWLEVTFPTSAITDAAVCPLAFFTAGHNYFTIQRDGYHAFSLSGLWQTLSLTNATFQVGITVNGTLVYNHNELDTTGSAAESNAYIGGALEYYGLHKLLTGDVVRLVFKRVGASYAEPINVEELVFAIHTVDNYGNNSTSPHAWNSHVDTNLGTPGAGQDQHPTVWDNASGKYVISSLAMGSLVAHTFGQHSNANANLTAPGAGLDQYVIVWDQASGSFKLVLNAAVAAAHALNSHTDTNLGSPGAGQADYYVGWDNGTSKYTLKAPGTPAAHTLDSHSNVTITTVANGQGIHWDSGTSKWVNYTVNLDSLSDVVITAPALNQVLQYNGTNFVNQSLIVSLNLDDLANVNMAGKAVNSVVRWNGTSWVPVVLSLASLSDVNPSGATVGQTLVFNGSQFVPGTPSSTAPAGAYCYANSGTAYASAGCTFAATGAGAGTFTAGSAGQWVIVVMGNPMSGSVGITVGGSAWAGGISIMGVGAAYRSAGGTFEFSNAGGTYNAVMFKIGT